MAHPPPAPVPSASTPPPPSLCLLLKLLFQLPSYPPASIPVHPSFAPPSPPVATPPAAPLGVLAESLESAAASALGAYIQLCALTNAQGDGTHTHT